MRATFWKCIAAVMEKCVALQPLLSKGWGMLPFVLGGALAFVLGAVAAELLLYIMF